MNIFSGKSAVVTGAASGIGYALCCTLVGQGARVYAADRNGSGLQTLQHICGKTLQPVLLDVTNETAVLELLVRVVSEQGSLDYLFNNAGITIGGHFEDMDHKNWEKIININLWGVIYGTRHAYNIMIKQKHGHIINTASTAGLIPVANETAYTTTKHAIVGLSRALREEARQHNVRVSAAIPGLVDTGIFSTAVNLGNHDHEAARSSTPIKKISPQHAAAAMLRGVERNEHCIIFPAYNKVLVFLHRLLPNFISWLINERT